MRTAILILAMIYLTACTPHVRNFILPPDPSPECVRQYARDVLHKDWPRAQLTRVGDDLTIIAEPSQGARSDYVIVDTVPRCR